jgi:putative RecB family exonuclease
MIATTFGHEPVDERPADVRAYVSASRLNAWLRCPLAFKLHYIDGIRSPPSPSMFIGKVVHSSLERFYRHRQLGLELGAADLARRLIESWGAAIEAEDMQFKAVVDEQLAQRQAIELVAAYVQQLPQDEPRPLAVEVSVEAPLADPSTGEDLGIPLLGIMDLVVPEEAGPIIADFKTAAKSSGPLEITHELQLSCYAYLFRQVSPVQEAGLEIRSLVKTKTPQVQFHRYSARTDGHFRRLFAVIREYLDALDSRRFVFRPSGGCASCEFCHAHCRRWSD